MYKLIILTYLVNFEGGAAVEKLDSLNFTTEQECLATAKVFTPRQVLEARTSYVGIIYNRAYCIETEVNL